MNLKEINPKKAINKAFLKIKPIRSEIEKFKMNLIQLIDHTNDKESEEFHKNLVSDFLKNTYYSPNHFINTKNRNDLVIHNGTDAKSSVGVIIEAKSTTNKAEMLSVSKLNSKAFQELVLYYLRERIKHHNLEVKHVVATNIYEWFVFDANLFEKLFAQNKSFVKQFTDFEEGRLAGKTTEFFYKQIAEPYIEEIKQSIEFTHFDIRDYEKPLRNEDVKDDNKLIALYKLLSPEHLLKLPFTNDSNSLDKRFYGELLHIIGLTETKEGGKKLIQRNKSGDRQSGTILENAIIQLDSADKINRLDKPSLFGDTNEERLFNVAMELTITWINRILFLKLLEAQLISYHKGDKSYAFLSIDKISDYDDLNSLFFQVLARKHDERIDDVKQVFAKVPYLNSSLFEPTDLEQNTLFISNLKDNKPIPVYSGTVLKDTTGKKKSGVLNTLTYFFEFLNAYDFTSEGTEEIQEDNKTLINASVLGLIFEKINGYKDGSFFTPGFITMYMCRETIRRSVVQKFNEAKSWVCKEFDDLYDKIEDKKEANEIINSLKICDPAVGSGHFLVSALNEIISIKNDLKILQDRDSKRLKEYQVEVVNDELIVTDEDGDLFEYNPTSKESQRVQETLFHEKQTIIENCLFGVDINPNSVKICRLRLWIELLKSAYYKNETELETLPNIDINIKCGNSLISRFAIDSDLSVALKKSKWNIDSYKLAVDTYRNATSKDEKREMEHLINDIKNDFKTEIDTPFKSKIKKARWDLNKLDTEINTKKQWGEKIEKNILIELEKATIKFEKLEIERDEIENNKIYENAFEWRFEFPDVLNSEGDFVGFDAVLGNPPYISLESFSLSERKYFSEKYVHLERKYESSVSFFIEGLSILKKNAILAYIAPLTWQTGENYSKFREFILSKKGLKKIINLPFNIFEDAFVDTAIYFINNCKSEKYKICVLDKKQKINNLSNINYSSFNISDIQKPDYKIILNDNIQKFSRFTNNEKFIELGSITKSTQGLSGSNFPESVSKNDENQFLFLAKGNVYNYSLIKEKCYITDLTQKKNLIQFYLNEPKILIRRIINRQNRLSVTFCDEKLVFKKDINPFIPIDNGYDAKYITAIIASKLISYIYLNTSSVATKDDFRQTTLTELRKLAIPILNNKKQLPFIVLVNRILVIKNENPDADTSVLENEIDKLVYQLYELTEEEIKIVEGGVIC